MNRVGGFLQLGGKSQNRSTDLSRDTPVPPADRQVAHTCGTGTADCSRRRRCFVYIGECLSLSRHCSTDRDNKSGALGAMSAQSRAS